MVDGDEQHEGQGQQHDAREPAFARQGLDLAPDAEAVADQAADLVEDFGQVAAGLPLQDHGGDEELQIQVGDPLGQAAEAFVQGDAQVLLLEDAAEFLADGQAAFPWPPC